jgi:hypothetical protein
MPPSSGNQVKSLKDYPEIAIAITEFISGFNSMEMLMHGLVSQILGDGKGLAHAFLARWNSFSNKLEIIVDIAKLSNDDPGASSVIIKHKQSLKDLNTFRNILAHSAFGVNLKGVVAISYMVSNKQPVTTDLTVDLFDKKRSLLDAVMTAFRDVIKPGLYRKG